MTADMAQWIAVDWGTSNLRAWIMSEDGAVIAGRSSDKGMSSVPPGGFEAALLELIGPSLPETGTIPVIACGMVGAHQGWINAPYATTPCAPPGLREAARPETRDSRLDVHILPGVKQADPADVMRGEETQIAGFLTREPDFDGVLCLPGTHSKWVHISAREIVSFRTFMSGELFALLSQHSVLRFSVEGDDAWDADAFAAAVDDALSSPQYFAARLFALRAEALLNGAPAATMRARLSGILIGLELAGARTYWLGRDIAIIGAPALTALYRTALDRAGARSRDIPGDDLVRAGLAFAYKDTRS